VLVPVNCWNVVKEGRETVNSKDGVKVEWKSWDFSPPTVVEEERDVVISTKGRFWFCYVTSPELSVSLWWLIYFFMYIYIFWHYTQCRVWNHISHSCRVIHINFYHWNGYHYPRTWCVLSCICHQVQELLVILCLKHLWGGASLSVSDIDLSFVFRKLLDSIFSIWWEPESPYQWSHWTQST
jgi:hypothetical protein